MEWVSMTLRSREETPWRSWLLEGVSWKEEAGHAHCRVQKKRDLNWRLWVKMWGALALVVHRSGLLGTYAWQKTHAHCGLPALHPILHLSPDPRDTLWCAVSQNTGFLPAQSFWKCCSLCQESSCGPPHFGADAYLAFQSLLKVVVFDHPFWVTPLPSFHASSLPFLSVVLVTPISTGNSPYLFIFSPSQTEMSASQSVGLVLNAC